MSVLVEMFSDNLSCAGIVGIMSIEAQLVESYMSPVNFLIMR